MPKHEYGLYLYLPLIYLRMKTAYLLYLSLYIFANTGFQYLSAVFGRHHYMIPCIIYYMCLLSIFHSIIIHKDIGYFHLRPHGRSITKE